MHDKYLILVPLFHYYSAGSLDPIEVITRYISLDALNLLFLLFAKKLFFMIYLFTDLCIYEFPVYQIVQLYIVNHSKKI